MKRLNQIKANRLLFILVCIIAVCFTSCTPKDWYLGEWQGSFTNKFDPTGRNNAIWTLTVNPDNTCHILIERDGLVYEYDCTWEPVSNKIIKITDNSKNIRVYPNGGNVYVDKWVVYLNTKGKFGSGEDSFAKDGLQMKKISK